MTLLTMAPLTMAPLTMAPLTMALPTMTQDIFEELTNIGGDLEQLRVCENLSDHLTGNVYAKFREEEVKGKTCLNPDPGPSRTPDPAQPIP